MWVGLVVAASMDLTVRCGPAWGLMKPDRSRHATDAIQRAHLADPADVSHTMFRYEPPDEMAELISWFWIPVWSVPPGLESPQRVLQYPCSLLVITEEYARFYGVVRGLSTTTLVGDGWAVGVRFQPAAGYLLSGRPMIEFTDRHVELNEVLGELGDELTEQVRTTMRSGDPTSVESHEGAIALTGDAVRSGAPVDEEGRLVNELVEFVESHPEVVTVSQVGERFGLSERSLQRILRRRLGLSPKWLIQRRRLQEASVRLRRREPDESLAALAADLGYADHAHLSRDFRAVTGWSPAEFAAHFGVEPPLTDAPGT